jgi:hypothetical protein
MHCNILALEFAAQLTAACDCISGKAISRSFLHTGDRQGERLGAAGFEGVYLFFLHTEMEMVGGRREAFGCGEYIFVMRPFLHHLVFAPLERGRVTCSILLLGGRRGETVDVDANAN